MTRYFYAPVDQAPLRVIGERFTDTDLVIVSQPTYGRVLFTQHDVEFSHCYLSGGSLYVPSVNHITIRDNHFIYAPVALL